MTPLKAAIAGTCLALAGCAGTPDRYVTTAPAVARSVSIAFDAVELRDISLPSYAAADEITVQDLTGKLVSQADVLWADSPERGVALDLARNLARLTGARVASEPWPFEAFPDARLEVRFETLLAEANGRYTAAGQYFVAVTDGGRERSGLFDLSVPYDFEGGPAAIAAARGLLILDLAEYLAWNGLR